MFLQVLHSNGAYKVDTPWTGRWPIKGHTHTHLSLSYWSNFESLIDLDMHVIHSAFDCTDSSIPIYLSNIYKPPGSLCFLDDIQVLEVRLAPLSPITFIDYGAQADMAALYMQFDSICPTGGAMSAASSHPSLNCLSCLGKGGGGMEGWLLTAALEKMHIHTRKHSQAHVWLVHTQTHVRKRLKTHSAAQPKCIQIERLPKGRGWGGVD